MPRYVFDIEANELLQKCTKVWLICAYDLDTKETRDWLEGDLSWIELFKEANMLIGHNILGYDLPVLEKLFGFKPSAHTKLFDTLIVSQISDYKRFGLRGHSLQVWGEALNFPKIEFDDFSKFSEEMRTYCHQDVNLTVMVYNELKNELAQTFELLETREKGSSNKLKTYIKAEHATAKWCSKAALHGWPFDVNAALRLVEELTAEMDKAHEALNSRLGIKCVAIDKRNGVAYSKKPKWTKAGFYDSHTANWFKIDPCSGYEGEERPIWGEYTRVEFSPLSLDSIADVKIFLFKNGWKPTEWNTRLNTYTNKKERTSPKITEDSLEFLGGDGKLYTEFLTAKSRYGILKTWLENLDEKGNLHGDCMTIGTPSMRARHSIIVNVPSADSPWGKEMRSLFTCTPGWKLIGCDSSGNQARGLAHYLKNEQFIDTLLNGDIHQYNADVLTAVLKTIDVDHTVPRGVAKRILYAFLFGASGSKLWSYIFGNLDDDNGKKLKNGFLKAVPGFKDLLEKLENIYGKTSKIGDGYIPSLAGNRIYVDSFHKLLVYLLQSAEKITCTAALMLTMENLEKESIPYIPLIFYHDEIDFMVPEEHAQRAMEIGRDSFKEGPKLFGVEIMDGGGKVGNTWYDIH
jgi:DNA polymerase-1